MKCPSITKTALTAQKARALAKSVGLIPHQNSQWKWALRQLRKANPKGLKNAPLMLSGKALAKAKERIGKLPNNVKQKIKALLRKQRLGVEVGISEEGKAFIGSTKGYLDAAATRAHAHVRFNRILNKLKANKGNKRYLDIADDILIASPSGQINWNKASYKNFLRRKDTYEKAIKKYEMAINKKYGPLEKSFSPKIRKYQSKALKGFQRASLYNRINTLGAGTGTMDMGVIRRIGRPHSILSKNVEGVHKSRLKLPGAVRSVYFEGGL